MKKGEFRSIPIVGVTAYADETNFQLCLTAGMDMVRKFFILPDLLYIEYKPLELDTLRHILSHYGLLTHIP